MKGVLKMKYSVANLIEMGAKKYVYILLHLSISAVSVVEASETFPGDSWPLDRQYVEKQLFAPGRLCIDSNRKEQTCTSVISLEPSAKENEVSIGLSSFAYLYPRPGVKIITHIDARWESSKLCFHIDEATYMRHSLYHSNLADTIISDNALSEEQQAEWRKTVISTLMDKEQEPICIRFYRTEGTQEDEYQIQEISFSKGQAKTRGGMRQAQLIHSDERRFLTQSR